MKFIDIHAHTNFAVYGDDRADVIKRALKSDTWLINVGTQQNTSQEAVMLAEDYPEGVYAIIGLHPIHTDKSYHDSKELGAEGAEFTSRGEVFDPEFYRDLAKSKKVVGIGECGLDYYRTEPSSLEKQRTAFHEQIKLALELDLPLMLHIRPSQDSLDAYLDVLEILEEYKTEYGKKLRGNAHFFAGTVEIANRFISLGFTISFTGVITFAKEYEEVIRDIQLEHIMSETDCPYVTPAPHRGTRNEPVYVQEVVKKIAEIKEIPLEKVQKQLIENARRLYNKLD